MKKLRPVQWIHLFGLAVLLVGLTSATSIYIYQGHETYRGEILRYEVEGGRSYPVYAQDNKSFRTSSQAMGGSAMEITNDFRFWLRSLAYGKRKAYTVAVVAGLVCFLCFWVPSYLRYDVA